MKLFKIFPLYTLLKAEQADLKDEQDTTMLDNFRARLNGKTVHYDGNKLKCIVCNENSYDDCYNYGEMKSCYGGSCFLQVRYEGNQEVQIQSGCQQATACINNMKQNFLTMQDNGPVVKLENAQNHQCKLYSSGKKLNSVCHNCCFKNDCTRNWQPKSFDEWKNLPEVNKVEQTMLFNQFNSPPTLDGQFQMPYFSQSVHKSGPTGSNKKEEIKTEFIIKNKAMKWALNVDKNGKVDPKFNQEINKKQTQVNKNLPKSSKWANGSPSGQSFRPSSTSQPVTKPITKIMATKAVKKGPWSHFPLWKQRQLQRLRAKKLAEKQATNVSTPVTENTGIKSTESPKTAFTKVSYPVSENTGIESTASPKTASTKKGPWSHLPQWKQNQLRRIRDKRIQAKLLGDKQTDKN